MKPQEKFNAMKQIENEIADFTISPLYGFRVKEKNLPVVGEGSYDAQIMFVGEAPGKNEAAKGRPFCGASGRILDELLLSAGIDRQKVYITNIVKDRPPENRDPLPLEIDLYAPFLDRQIEIIQPKIIATLGRFAMGYVMQRYGLVDSLEPISKAHGKKYITKMTYGDIVVIPFYHPAVAVYNAHMKDALKQDFAILKEYD